MEYTAKDTSGEAKRKILIAEDDPNILELLKLYMCRDGFEVETAVNGGEALAKFRIFKPDLVLLDVMMPVLDGISATEVLRRESNIPIILLTAKSESSDKVLGLTVGADDYITKPFDPMEVLARVRSQLRRYTMLGGAAPKPAALRVGGILLDDETKQVTLDGDPVSLTPIEYDLLHFLLKNPGKVYSSKELYESVWHESALGSEGVVAVHIRHLREKLEITPSDPRYLKVVWGRGYKLEEKP